MAASPLDVRRERLMKLMDLSAGRGLEVGPLCSPIVTTEMADVSYLDVFSRDQLRANYADDLSVSLDDIPEITFVLSGPDGIRTLCEAVSPRAPFSWVVASHVVEHVPDVITWLAEIAEVLDDGGRLFLVVPDRHFTFDILRPATTVGQMLQSHELRDTRPSIRAVYDMFRNAVRVRAHDAWRGEIPGQEARLYGLAEMVNAVRRGREGEYVDCHVWTFTPASFVEQLTDLGVLDLCDFVVETIVSTPENDLEFYAVLRRMPRTLTLDQRAAARAEAVLEVPDTDPSDRLHRVESERLTTESERLSAELAAVRVELAELDEQVRISEKHARELGDELVQVKASERWHLGGLAIAPASAVKRLFTR